jgi:glycosyltransferase involved in cell wall biosynthesis
MGLFGLYLKHAYTVEASFYMHTDWLMFARKVLNIEGHNLSRLRRILRSFYQAFDHMFVLNSDQQDWLSGTQMNLNPKKVHLTAHWTNARFKPAFSNKKKLFGIPEESPVLLYVGRISKEKGVLELTMIYQKVKQKYPKARLAVVGKGPVVQQLKDENPDAVFIDWVDRDQLPEIYSSADILILPSRFDTFSNVVLESLSCGLPVIAYNTKGPKNIIRDGKDGYLVNNQHEISERIIHFLGSKDKEKDSFKRSAIERAASYNPDVIITNLMESVGLHETK